MGPGKQALALAAALLLIAASGCDFFSSSGASLRVSPFIRDLQLSKTSVSCNQNYTITFRYEDLQDDIEFIRLDFQHTTDSFNSFEDSAAWEDGGDLDLSVVGRAILTHSFGCGEGLARGLYILQVTLEDARGHESNSRTATVTLLTS